MIKSQAVVFHDSTLSVIHVIIKDLDANGIFVHKEAIIQLGRDEWER